MASGHAAQQNFRRALGALKDSTKVGVAKVNSDYKAIDVALVKATNHDEVLPKEKHIRTIFDALSASRPRADVAYCIQSLSRRLAKTHTWTVGLKTLIVIHRAMREVDPTVFEELSNYTVSRGHLLNISHLKDGSSAWENSAWARTYALYLEESLECFRILKYDIQRERSRIKRLDTPDLLDQLPAMQKLLFRLLACQPQGSSRYNFLIQYALSIVAAESVHLYVGITDGMLNLVDKFFEMQRQDAVKAIEIYRKAIEQAEKISEFFEMCSRLEFGRKQKYVKIEQPPASFIKAMEDYVRDTPQTLMLPWRSNEEEGSDNERQIVVEAKSGNSDNLIDVEEEKSDKSPNSNTANNEAVPPPPIADLLCLDEIDEGTPLDDTKAVEPATDTPDLPSSETGSNQTGQPTSWELALVTASSSNVGEVTEAKLYQEGGGLNRSVLDRLYDAATANTNTNPNRSYQMGTTTSNPFEEANHVHGPVQVGSNPFEATNLVQDPLYCPSNVAPGTDLQIVARTPDQESLMHHQQHPSSVDANPVMDPFHSPSGVAPGTNVPIVAATAQDQEPFMHLQQHQQQQEVMVGNDSTNPFMTNLTEQNTTTSLPSQSQSPSLI